MLKLTRLLALSRRLLRTAGRPFSALKRYLPRGLMGRAVLITLVPLVLVQATALFVFYERHYRPVSERLAEAVAGDIAAVAFMVERTQGGAQRDEVFALARRTMLLNARYDELPLLDPPSAAPDGGGITLNWLARTLRTQGYAFRIETQAGATQGTTQSGSLNGSTPNATIGLNLPALGGALIVAIDDRRLVSSTTYLFAIWLTLISLLLFGVATIFLRNQVRPIRRLAQAADRYGAGTSPEEIPLQGATEVRAATLSFQRMQRRLNRFLDQRTQMLSGVSHDLRTPLTRMKLQLAMLPDRTPVSAEDRTALEQDVREMEQMVDGYLAWARGEGGETRQRFDLAAMLRELVADYEREGTAIEVSGLETPLMIEGKREALKRCASNLLSNARRYGNGWTSLSLVVNGPPQSWTLTIEDDGPGIAEADHKRAFQPFQKLNDGDGGGGTGLGLAIAQDIARDHGSEVELERSAHGGLKVRITV